MPDQPRKPIFSRVYGMRQDEYERIVAHHQRCYICGADNPGPVKRFVIDFDPETGEVRGLLCRKCSHG